MKKQVSLMTDEELMQAYSHGSYEAFEELYNRHSGRVYGYLKSKLNSRSLADDVFQDTFLRLHRYRRRYDRAFPFLPWLFTLCRSSMVDAIRKAANASAAQRLDAPAVSLPEHATAGPGLDLGGLSDREQEVVSLHYFDDLSFDDIAQRLGIKPALARKVSSRAIAKLRSAFSWRMLKDRE